MIFKELTPGKFYSPVKMCKELHLQGSIGKLLNLYPQEHLDAVQ